MLTREQYVEQMKKQVDEWNARLAAWEVEVQKAQADVRIRYEAQINALGRQRDEAVKRLNETRNASLTAWTEVSRGAEAAWRNMQSGFEKAWGEFHKKKP
jgi:hypothetical protein